MARHDWNAIKKEYVEGVTIDGQLTYPTQASLCKKYNIEKALMSRRAKADQWDTQREIFNNKITTERQQKKVDVISDEGSQFDLDCFNAAKAGLFKAYKNIGNCYQIEDLAKLSTAIKNFQAVGKASLGDKQDVDGEVKIRVSIKDADN